MTKVQHEFTSGADIYLLFEKGMRNGVSYISERHSKAKNKYLKSYDPKQESKHIMFLDASNLYGSGRSKFFHPAALNGKTLKRLTQINTAAVNGKVVF